MDGRIRRILVADDNRWLLRFTKALLEARLKDVEVVPATEGSSALDELAAATFALAVIATDLPGLRGADALLEVRRLAPGMPVLVLSGDPADERWARDGGADAFMTKPFDAQAFVEVVARFVVRRHAGVQ